MGADQRVDRGEGGGEALVEDFQGEVFLRREVVVETAVGHPGRLHQLVDAHPVDPAGPEALAGGGHDARAVQLFLLP